MSRYFNLYNDWYGDDCEIFKNYQIKIDTGLTVLVGCNGAGKTTMLNQIEDMLDRENIPVLFHNNMTNGERDLKSKATFYGDFEMVARLMSSSEGENIVNVLGEVARKMGDLSRKNPKAKELWFLFDSIDSGLSIDNVIEFKEELIPVVLENNKDKDMQRAEVRKV